MSVGDLYKNTIFLSCFSHSSKSDKKMWKYFADDYKGARIVFNYENNFIKTIIDYDKTINAYKNDGSLVHYFCALKSPQYDIFKNLKNSDKGENIFKIFVELLLKDVIYCENDLKNISTTPFDTIDALILNKASSFVINKYNFQNESRIICILRPSPPKDMDVTNFEIFKNSFIEIADFDYLLLPIKFDNLKSLDIHFGKKVDVREIDLIKKLIIDIPTIKLFKSGEIL